MNQLRISVCIATMNRGGLIGTTLESIISQATDEVEIVVVDGASTDNTQEIVCRCQERFPRLRYFRQDTNKGIDNDFAEAVRLAQGEYCWLFSDDDLLKAGAIQAVLEVAKGQYSLIIANAEVRNADLSKVLQHRRLPLKENQIYESGEGNRFFEEVKDYISFIGCVIIKRELWNSREKEKYFGSFFIHVGVIYQSPLPETALVIAEPLILIRYGNASWLEKYFEIWMFKWPELIWSFEHYSDASKRQASHKEPWRRLRSLALSRAKGSYSIDVYRRWLEPRLETSWGRTRSEAIAHFPGVILNLMALLYYLARGDKLALLDLINSPFYFGRSLKRSFGDNKNKSATNSRTGIVSRQPVVPQARPPVPLGKNDSRAR